MTIEAAEDGCVVNHGGGVHGSYRSRQGDNNTGSFETGNMSHYENTTSKKGTKARSFQKDTTHA